MICANKDCSIEFDPKTHNQKYHSDDCCRIATNRKIMEKYYEKKSIRQGKIRLCKKCNSKLSRYNQSNVCSKCEKASTVKNRKSVMDIINDIS